MQPTPPNPNPVYNNPPMGGPTLLQPARKGNGFATASLVCSLLICVPVVAQLLGILFGIIGLVKSGGGRGGVVRSIFGLVISCIVLAGIGLATIAGVAAWQAVKPGFDSAYALIAGARDSQAQVIRAVSAAEITDAQIEQLLADVKARGGIDTAIPMPGSPSPTTRMPNLEPPQFVLPLQVQMLFKDGSSRTLEVILLVMPAESAKIISFKWRE